MFIQQALEKELKLAAAVTALAGERIYYAGNVPQEVAYPYIVLQKISDVPDKHSFDAASEASVARIQISIFSDNYYTCQQIADAVKAAINGFKGTMGGGAGVAVGGCFLESDNDLPPEDKLAPYGIAADYILHY